MRIAVVGVGYLGEHHVRVLSEIEDVQLCGVVDIREDRAIDIASRFKVEAFFDYRDVLKKVDALSIVTPTVSHHEIALNALRAGKDLFIEKPITATIEEADELIEEAEKRGCILQVGHIERYNPAIRALYDVIEKPFFFESERLSPFLGRGSDVDVTVDLMIHDLDIILDIVNSDIREIRAEGISVLTPMIDVARAWIDFEDGTAASLLASRVSSDKVRLLRVFDSTPIGKRLNEINYKEAELRMIKEGMEEFIRPEYKEPLREELRDFVNSVMTRKPPRVTGIQAKRALEVALDINSVIRKGWSCYGANG